MATQKHLTSNAVLATSWAQGTLNGRERAILSFLVAGPLAAARIALSMERCGSDGAQRFLLDVEGYVLDPDAWRKQALERDRKREDERRISNEAAAEERAAQEGL